MVPANILENANKQANLKIAPVATGLRMEQTTTLLHLKVGRLWYVLLLTKTTYHVPHVCYVRSGIGM